MICACPEDFGLTTAGAEQLFGMHEAQHDDHGHSHHMPHAETTHTKDKRKAKARTWMQRLFERLFPQQG